MEPVRNNDSRPAACSGVFNCIGNPLESLYSKFLRGMHTPLYVCCILLMILFGGTQVQADSFMGIEMGTAQSAEEITADMIADRAAQVMQFAHDHGFQYGNSTSLPPCADGIIACDRLAAAVLWTCGFTDQPRGGITLDNGYDGYLTGHGFIRSEGIGELKRGSIVKVNKNSGGTHMFICTEWDGSTLVRCDAGWQGGITGISQPFAGRFFWDPATAVVYNVPDLPVNDWKVTEEGSRFYDENREPLSGLQEIDGKTYYFSEANYLMQTGFLMLEDGWHYFAEDGSMQTGLVSIPDPESESEDQTDESADQKDESGDSELNSGNAENEYYFNDAGVMQTGIQDVGGITCYFGKDGRRELGFHKYGGKKYYLTKTGTFSGWKTIKGKTYYFSGTDGGAAVKGWQKIEEKRYWFDSNAVMVTGWQEIDAAKYYFGEDGICAEGWQKIDGKSFYFTEEGMMTGWLELPEGTWYLHPDGTPARGYVTIDRTHYYFEPEDGRLYEGWRDTWLGRMYFTPDGAVENQLRVIDGNLYHFNVNGAMDTGWFIMKADRYFADGNGVIRTGWNIMDHSFVLFDKRGALTFRIHFAAVVMFVLLAAICAALICRRAKAQKKNS